MTEPRGTNPAGGGESARVRCLYCGANNYPSSATCWQCGRPLQALRSQPKAATAGGASSPPQTASAPSAPLLPFKAASSAADDSTLAPRAAAALGLMFPYIGLPVGMVFLMLDDPRKTQLGWITIGWSLAGTAINVVLLLATLGPITALFHTLIPSGGHGGGLPIPPLPGGGADDANLLLPKLFLPSFSMTAR